MNIALSALIISILLLPGSVVLTAYYTSLREKKSDLYIPFSELLFKGIVFSFIIHCCGICVLRWQGYPIDFQLIYDILIGNDKLLVANERFAHNVIQFLTYILVLLIICFSLTKWFKRIIIYYNMDIDFYSLKAANYWFLIFSGRFLDRRKKGARELTDLIYVDVLVKGNILYSGLVLDFNYSPKKDVLENLILKSAAKRIYLKTEETEPKMILTKPSFIPGDALVIPLDDVLNINIQYVRVLTKDGVHKLDNQFLHLDGKEDNVAESTPAKLAPDEATKPESLNVT